MLISWRWNAIFFPAFLLSATLAALPPMRQPPRRIPQVRQHGKTRGQHIVACDLRKNDGFARAQDDKLRACKTSFRHPKVLSARGLAPSSRHGRRLQEIAGGIACLGRNELRLNSLIFGSAIRVAGTATMGRVFIGRCYAGRRRRNGR